MFVQPEATLLQFGFVEEVFTGATVKREKSTTQSTKPSLRGNRGKLLSPYSMMLEHWIFISFSKDLILTGQKGSTSSELVSNTCLRRVDFASRQVDSQLTCRTQVEISEKIREI